MVSPDSIIIEDTPKEGKKKHDLLLRTSMNSLYDSARNSVLDLKTMILCPTSEDAIQAIQKPLDNTRNSFIEPKKAFFFDGELLTLRILFFDIFFIICALISDFVQAASILWQGIDKGKHNENFFEKGMFGLAAFSIIWAPGIPAAIHYLSVFRHRLVWYKSLIYALSIFLFYPVVPIIAKLMLLWVRPQDNKVTKEYKEAEYGATVAYAIHGCISAPIQLCYQSWLVLNGIIDIEFEYFKLDLSFIGLGAKNSETIEWPATVFSLVFSILT